MLLQNVRAYVTHAGISVPMYRIDRSGFTIAAISCLYNKRSGVETRIVPVLFAHVAR